jgi:phosphatidylserine decarboxylase
MTIRTQCRILSLPPCSSHLGPPLLALPCRPFSPVSTRPTVITVDQAIRCLEAELGRPDSEKRLDADDDGLPDSSVSATPVLSITGDRGQELQMDHLNFSGPSMAVSNPDDAGSKSDKHPTEPMQQPSHAVVAGAAPENSDSWSDDTEGDLSSTGPSPSGTPSPGISVGKKKMGRFGRINKTKSENTSDKTSQNASDFLERVINVKNCPPSPSETQLQS